MAFSEDGGSIADNTLSLLDVVAENATVQA